MKLDHAEKVWITSNAICWPIIIAGIGVMITLNIWAGLLIWVPSFITLMVILNKFLEGVWDE